MSNRNHSKSRSPVNAAQTRTIAASSQPDSLMLAPVPARADVHGEWLPDQQQSPGPSLQVIATPALSSPFAQLSGPTYRGDPPAPAPAPVSGLLRLFNSCILTPLRVHASPPFSRAWPLLSCPTRDRHLPCPLFLLSATATTGAASVLAEASPPSPASCATHQHAGSSVDEATCSLFVAIERVTCTAPACGGLRRVGARVCNRCGQASQARPPRVGDVIMGPLGAPVSREDMSMVDADAPATPSLTVDFPPVNLPADFTQRVRALPSSTILHVPASCRLRMISAVARCWNGMAQGRDDYGQLEEGRSKLLLSTVPQGLSVATEVQKRLTLWEEQSFETLLQRAEEQLLLKRKSGKRRKTSGPPDPSERGDRARRTAAVGAYRKATTGLVSSMLSFNEQEDVRWAQELLPTSNLGPSAHCDPHLAPPPALPESTWDRPFSFLHYAALTAPGSTSLTC